MRRGGFRRSFMPLKSLFGPPEKITRLRRDVAEAVAGRLTPVIIFQMGKVASSTVEATLETVPGLAVLRTHGLIKWAATSEPPPARRDLESWLVLHQLVRAGIPSKVVSIVRDPIARNLSAYFQNLDQFLGGRDAYARTPMPQLIEGFFTLLHHQRPLEWFDVEFRAALGVDVYQLPFDRERGCQRLATPQFDILLLRADLDDATKARELAGLVGAQELRLIQKNVGEAKAYAAIYEEFLRSIRLPESYVDEMLGHAFTRHFFTGAEIARLRAKWLRAPQVS